MNPIKALPKIICALIKPLETNIRPENIQVDITTSCNLSCKMCPRYALEEAEKNRSLSFEQFKNIIDKIMPGSVNMAATGEPFLHPDFFEMVKYAKKKSKAVTFTSSNLTSITPRIAADIISSGLDILKVSIDSPDPRTYKEIRGQDYLPKILENISLINRLKKENKSSTPSVRIDLVVLKDNFKQLKELIKLAADFGADAVNFRLLDASRLEENVKREMLSGFSSLEVIEELEKANLFAKEKNIKTNADDLLGDSGYIRLACGEQADVKPVRGVCLLPWLQLYISVSGDVSPCCSLYPSGKLGEGATGNIFTGPEEAWNGERMRSLRKLFRSRKNYSTFRACRNCNPMDMKNMLRALKMFPGIIKVK